MTEYMCVFSVYISATHRFSV